ncbi:MAG: hypothetical protein AAFX06_16765 [Planctomycetota bacterium]
MAITQAQRDIIENEVGIWMDASRMFTAFEISRAVKAKGVSLRHREMKEFIHAAIYRRRSRSYTRTLIDVGAPEQAWVYHPLTENPHSFRPLDRGDGRTRSATDAGNKFHSRNLTPLGDTTTPPSTAANGSYGCDAEGNVKLPASELSKIGVGMNEIVHVQSDPAEQCLLIGKPGDVQESGAEIETTSDSGELLLTHETLEFVDLDWLAGYQVRLDGNTLRVTDVG